MIGMYRVCAVSRVVILYDRYERVCTNHPVIRKDWSFRLVWSVLSCIRGGRCGVRGGGVYKLLAISVLPAQGFLARECVGMCVWGNLFPCSYRVYCFREYGSCGLLKYLVDFFFSYYLRHPHVNYSIPVYAGVLGRLEKRFYRSAFKCPPKMLRTKTEIAQVPQSLDSND